LEGNANSVSQMVGRKPGKPMAKFLSLTVVADAYSGPVDSSPCNEDQHCLAHRLQGTLIRENVVPNNSV
jgi:hypothetical protein